MKAEICILIICISCIFSSSGFIWNKLKYECDKNEETHAYKNFKHLIKVFVEKVNTMKDKIEYLKETNFFPEDIQIKVNNEHILSFKEDQIFDEIVDTLKPCFARDDYSDIEVADAKKLIQVRTCYFLLSVTKNTTAECERERNEGLEHCFLQNPSIKSLPILDKNMKEEECQDVSTLMKCYSNFTEKLKCKLTKEITTVNFELARVFLLSCDF